MKMSLEYMQETSEFFRGKGFSVDKKDGVLGKTMDGVECQQVTFTMTRPDESWEMQWVLHPTVGERYFLKLSYHKLNTHSLEIDSWKHKKGQIEVRYLTHDETGQNVTFTIDLA